MLKKFNELSLKDKAYLIGGLSLLVIVISFGLLNRQTVTVSLVFTQLSAPLILVIFTCLVIGIIAGSAIGISYHHNKTQDLRWLLRDVLMYQAPFADSHEGFLPTFFLLLKWTN